MIEFPPSLQDSSEEKAKFYMPALAETISRINDEYLYWSDVKYRGQPIGLTPEVLWSIVKDFRQKTDIAVWEHDDIHFSLTNAMQRRCHEFDMDFGGSWGASKIFPDDKTTQELYLISSIMEEAIASSQMEGAATTREVAKNMLRKKITPRDRSQRMILNNYNTINFIREHVNEPLTPALIMQLHGMMTADTLDIPDAAGRLRRADEDIVVGNAITGETVHRPPHADCLGSFMDNLCVFFNEQNAKVFIHPIIKAIVVHYLLAYYHPFADGNGRTARALFYWYMMKSNYWLVQYLSISRVIIKSKKRYEKAFLYSECDGNDIGYFIQYHLDVLVKSFDELRKYLKRKCAEKKQAERLLHLGNVSPRQTEIINMYVKNPDMVGQTKDVMAKFRVSAGTAKSDLKNLAMKGYLKEIALDGRTKAYVRSGDFMEMINVVKD